MTPLEIFAITIAIGAGVAALYVALKWCAGRVLDGLSAITSFLD
jgi:hypothetical protein